MILLFPLLFGWQENQYQANIFFFYWATEWALKYHNPTRPVEPAGPSWGRSGPRKKKNSSSKRAGSGPRVFARRSGPDMEKPDPLPFLDWISIGSIRSVFSCFQFLRTKEIRDNQKKKPISLYFPTFSQHPNTKQTKKNSKSCILLGLSIDPAHPTRRVLGGLNGCLGRVRVQYFWSALGSGPTRPDRSLKQNTHTQLMYQTSETDPIPHYELFQIN